MKKILKTKNTIYGLLNEIKPKEVAPLKRIEGLKK